MIFPAILIFGEEPLRRIVYFSNIPADQKLLILVSYMAAVVVIWYTWETRTLRKLEAETLEAMKAQTSVATRQAKEATRQGNLVERQLDAQLRPYIDMNLIDDVKGIGAIFEVRNIGSGMACNVRFNPIELAGGVNITPPIIASLAAGGNESITSYTLWESAHKDNPDGTFGNADTVRGIVLDKLNNSSTRITLTMLNLNDAFYRAVFEYDPRYKGKLRCVIQAENSYAEDWLEHEGEE